MYAYCGIASEHGFTHVVGEVQRIADMRHPAEQIRQAH